MYDPSQYYGDSTNHYSCPQAFWSYGHPMPPTAPVPLYYQNQAPPMYATNQGYMAPATGSESVKIQEFPQYCDNDNNVYASNNGCYVYSQQYNANNAINYCGTNAYSSGYSRSGFPVTKIESQYEANISHSKLPSPESFIKECRSGKKSNERLNKEELIKNSLVHSKSGPSKSKPNSNKKNRDSSFKFVPVKKESFKKSASRTTNFCKESKSKHETNEEFLKRWRLVGIELLIYSK
jgi:hypothetical protein